MQTFDGESLELLKHGYNRYLLAELHCHEHGEFRICDVSFISDRRECPRCGLPCEYVILGMGITRRELPIVEFILNPTPQQYQVCRRAYVKRREERVRAAKRSQRADNYDINYSSARSWIW